MNSANAVRLSNNLIRRYRFFITSASVLLIAVILLPSAHAQNAAPDANTPPTATASQSANSLQVGDATRTLLEKQRTGVLASETPRFIDGEVAQRSYERYLRSFERPIPENFTSVASPAGKAAR